MKKHLYILLYCLCCALNLNAQEEFEIIFPIHPLGVVQEGKLLIDALGSEFGEKVIHSSDTSFVIISTVTNSTDGIPRQHIHNKGIVIRELNYEGEIIFEKSLFIKLNNIFSYSNLLIDKSKQLLIPYNKNSRTYCGVGVKLHGNKRGVTLLDSHGNKLNDIEFTPNDCKDEFLGASFVDEEGYIQFYKIERDSLFFEKRDHNFELLHSKSIDLPYYSLTTTIIKLDSTYLHVHLKNETLSITCIDKFGEVLSKKTNKLNLKNKSAIKHSGYINSKENDYFFTSYTEEKKITSNIYTLNSERKIIDSVSLYDYEIIDLCFYKGNLLVLINKTHSICDNKIGITLFDKKLNQLYENFYDTEYLQAKSISPTSDDSFIIIGSKIKPYQCFKKNEKCPSQTFLMKKQLKL